MVEHSKYESTQPRCEHGANITWEYGLILIELHPRLLSIPALMIQLAILALPAESMPSALCLYLEWTVGFMRVNHYLGGLAIALSRQVLLNMVECKILSVSQ